MKSLRIYLIVVAILLFLGLGFGVYAWYVFQTFEKNQDTLQVNEISNQERSIASSSNQSDSEEKSIVIDANALTDTQRNALESFGYSKDNITITPQMVLCAKDAVGERRLDEITKGSAPTPLESLKLIPCFK